MAKYEQIQDGICGGKGRIWVDGIQNPDILISEKSEGISVITKKDIIDFDKWFKRIKKPNEPEPEQQSFAELQIETLKTILNRWEQSGFTTHIEMIDEIKALLDGYFDGVCISYKPQSEPENLEQPKDEVEELKILLRDKIQWIINLITYKYDNDKYQDGFNNCCELISSNLTKLLEDTHDKDKKEGFKNPEPEQSSFNEVKELAYQLTQNAVENNYKTTKERIEGWCRFILDNYISKEKIVELIEWINNHEQCLCNFKCYKKIKELLGG